LGATDDRHIHVLRAAVVGVARTRVHPALNQSVRIFAWDND
jgi:hypothetical protein